MNITKARWYLKTKLSSFKYGKIGHHSYVGKPLFIQNPKSVYIGNNVRIYPGMRAELTTPSATIYFKDNISVGQNLHIVCYKDELIIGSNTTISANVFISNVDHEYKMLNKHILDQNFLYKKTIIGENCFIGYGAVIMPGTILGKQCIVGANSTVKGHFPDYCVIAGSPAKIIKKYNSDTNEWEKVH